MPRPVMYDCASVGQAKEASEREKKAKEQWFRDNKNQIWANAMGPIQGRIMSIMEDKEDLLRKLMDSRDEYFKFCKATPVQPPQDDTFVVHVGTDRCDECYRDPTIAMRTPPPQHTALLAEGISAEGAGRKRYLRTRYDAGLPETKFCYPPTSNSEYAWKLMDSVRCIKSECSNLPRQGTIGPAFYRSRGVLCRADYAPFTFPTAYHGSQ